MSEKIKVVFILGYGHSGSTLLDIILGNSCNILSTGELAFFNPLLSPNNNLCSCGSSHSTCHFWNNISKEFIRLSPIKDHSTLARYQRHFDNWRSIKCWNRLICGSSAGASFYNCYLKSLQDIYEAISRISNCSTIIDSSKSPCRALSISNLSPAVDLRIVHLVRDGRAVLWSMLKKHKKKSTAPLSKRRELTTLFRTIIGWTLINIQSEIVGKIFGSKRYLRIRYEDLVKNNESFLLKISKSIDQPILAPNQIFGTGGQYRANHLVAGNDMRFQKIITLRPDFEWRNKLPLEYKFIFQFFGKVLLKRYGYMKSIS